jgi:SAM-dependent methyltransferase
VNQPRLYTDIAEWFHLLTRPEDYAEEAAFYHRILQSAGVPDGASVLELGSGGGNNASHLKQHYRLTLVDLSPGMLALSRSLNPEQEHIQGDMRSVRLGRLFQAVFIQDAICYMTGEDDLRQAIQTAALHLEPGGAAIFHPDHTRETFQPSTDHGGHGDPGGGERALRYLEWTWDADPTDTHYRVDFAYLLYEGDGSVRCEYDQHTLGVFPAQTWLELMREAGFQPQMVPFEHSEVQAGTSHVFLGIKD